MFSRREKGLLVAAVIVVSAAAVVQFAPGREGRGTVDEARVLGRWRAAHKRVQALETRLGQLTVPTSSAVPQLVRAAQTSGAATGVTLASVRPRRPLRKPSGMQENAIEVQVTGRFPQVVKFIADLRAQHPKVHLGRTAISSVDGASDQVSATVVIATYASAEERK